jgi:hypothetical protein
VAFSFGYAGLKATVMKFDGNNWVDVGSPGFSTGQVAYVSMAFNPFDSLPYVAYADLGNYQKATVMKFDNTNWINVGYSGFSAGNADWISLAISPSGQPYVSYEDEANSNKATVMKFDGVNWASVGAEGVTSGEAYVMSLAFNPSGEPYLAFVDGAYNNFMTVMKFDGTNWVYVGSPGFSAGRASYTSLVFSPSDGQPYVAYTDDTNYRKATVMNYDSVFVGIKEQQQSSFSVFPNPATDKITIEIAACHAPSQLSMMNLNGEEVLTRSLIKPKTQIDISNLSGGVYFVRLTNDKTVEVGKFVKQ